MKIFLVEPSMTMKETEDAYLFLEELTRQLQLYAINFILVQKENINKSKFNIEDNSLIVLFNDKADMNYERIDIDEFLRNAKQRNASFWTVAMNKDSRIPSELISKKQSYDVWEQLRCRNLGAEYLPVVAKVFSRKIISEVMPTIYSEKGLIFVSHRRLDGEEISAKLCDRISIQARNSNVFRDITEVQVGDEAQNVIDSAMSKSDVFIFIHTHKSSESDWIQKELRYALLRNIPILWVQIDHAKSSDLLIKPTEKPHLSYNSSDFEDDNKLVKITDEILQMVFELAMLRNNKVFGSLDALQKLFDGKMSNHNRENMVYSVSVSRKGYRYPQRNILQYFQLYGRTPTKQDEDKLKKLINTEGLAYDSIIILTDRVVRSVRQEKLVIESFDDFYYYWNKYLNFQKENKNMEIVISGAFPDSDKIYKQSLTDALTIFAKSILKDGYTLTFGSHPTFRELFFEIANEVCSENANKVLKMYISKWFEKDYANQRAHFLEHAQFIETEKSETVSTSLMSMRKEMIQRENVSALICLGGKIKENKEEEGLREEIRIAQEYRIPVFVVGTVGGCSSEVALEFKNCSWNGLNEAPETLNKLFMESLDYFTLSQEMLSYLDAK